MLPEAIIGSFTVTGPQQDSVRPQAELLTTQPITPTTSLRVRYTDNEIVNGGSLDSGDLRAVHVTTGNEIGAELYVAGNFDGPLIETQYRLIKADGPWASEDFGEYELHLNPAEVFDIAGNSADGQFLGTVVFESGNVPIRVTARNDAPVAFVTQVSPVEFTLDFTPGIAETTLNGSNVLVVNAAGEQLRVELAGSTASGSIATQADYQIYPPSDSWQENDIGDYAISLAADELLGASGEAVPPLTLGTLSVLQDGTRPFAALPPFETNGPGEPVAVVVNYQNRTTGIRLSTIDDGDLQVVHLDSGEVLPVDFVGDFVGDFGNAVSDLFASADYRFTPHQTGPYELRLLDGEVEDMSGLTIEARRLSIFWVVDDATFTSSPRRSLRSLIGRRST